MFAHVATHRTNTSSTYYWNRLERPRWKRGTTIGPSDISFDI